ncbi:response regulator [Coralliovum pocilloporae]|uniref:response regulator n=1 Tax=Coralliovum pocilloporae TaxID=3066369 RepID=UPI003306D111
MYNLDLKELSFVIADDSSYMRTILRMVLQAFGVRQIVEAEDGVAALEAMEKANPDIVLLDRVMPVLDGAEVMRILRNPDNPFAFVPVIMVTAYTERSTIVEARNLGVHEILSKPISAKALYQRVASVVLKPREFIKTPTYFGPKPRETVKSAPGSKIQSLRETAHQEEEAARQQEEQAAEAGGFAQVQNI